MLTISELYLSVQGESTRVGRPCVFVRLTACDLRCTWCDTPHAFTGGRKMSLDAILQEVRNLGCPLVELTGGEPLLQPETIPLMAGLLGEGYEVLLETGGHLSTAAVPEGVRVILDVKCPGSGEAEHMHWPNLEQLSAGTEVKFVVRDRADFDYASDVIARYRLGERAAAVLLAPVFGVLEPERLAEWLLASKLPARLQLQVHKYIWAPDARGV